MKFFTNSLLGENRKGLKILLPQNTPQIAFFGFQDNKENVEIIDHLHLIFKYYLFKSRDTQKLI